MNDTPAMIDQARAAREQARALLGTLLDAHRAANGTGKDLYKKVTGASSLERSIASTRKLIETYDRVLGEADGTGGSMGGYIVTPTGRSTSLNLSAAYAARSA